MVLRSAFLATHYELTHVRGNYGMANTHSMAGAGFHASAKQCINCDSQHMIRNGGGILDGVKKFMPYIQKGISWLQEHPKEVNSAVGMVSNFARNNGMGGSTSSIQKILNDDVTRGMNASVKDVLANAPPGDLQVKKKRASKKKVPMADQLNPLKEDTTKAGRIILNGAVGVKPERKTRSPSKKDQLILDIIAKDKLNNMKK